MPNSNATDLLPNGSFVKHRVGRENVYILSPLTRPALTNWAQRKFIPLSACGSNSYNGALVSRAILSVKYLNRNKIKCLAISTPFTVLSHVQTGRRADQVEPRRAFRQCEERECWSWKGRDEQERHQYDDWCDQRRPGLADCGAWAKGDYFQSVETVITTIIPHIFF